MKKIFVIFTALLIISLGGLGAYMLQTSARKLPVRQYFPTDKTVAVWDWTDPTSRTSADLEQLDTYYYFHQINTVYVDISSYPGLMNDPVKKRLLSNALASYVKALNDHNIKVFAAAGNPDWSKPAQRSIPLNIQNYVFEYNSQHPDAKLSGIEFDIESYNQAGFADSSMTEKSITLTELLQTVLQLSNSQHQYLQAHKHDKLELGFAVPYWFDNENGNIPAITWNSKTGPTLYHLVDTLNILPKANIVVMAYRNAATGNDGVIFHSRTEIEYARAKAPNVSVVVGQEVNSVDPPKITYFDKSIAEFAQEVRIINYEYKDNTSYSGIAINDLSGLQLMDSTGLGN